ncbi:intradiol ring-cleavage dioxygenase [Pseudoprimorskyibacter insulae]|uniref:Catechol 1,2-dioxygenase n=1 Tax=Pseudoprimorskyibacter insulae TaxID=1695997 RepID=A0A2R8AP52_9RHOB|nr:intradiol ring-cleavage dioxygenase [Pseudoprimorskyibacter insulae]SPF77813.1 Catechol 1,2-dioxygenase [Pseudoprimorskyibacter insulae]
MIRSANLNRRSLLAGFAASPVVAAGIGAFPSAARSEAATAGLISPNVCMVLPEVTEGPYYFDPELVRADITEGKPGIPLKMQLQVVSADCTPIPGARVDIWHCDALGNYSGYKSQGSDGTNDTSGETFLRGTLMTDDSGIAAFTTIYPGWYRGRTTHIHYKVFLDERTVLTSQIFFPDALSEYLFQNTAPYNERTANRDTTNANDGIAKQVGEGGYAAIREQYGYYDAALVVGVDDTATSTQSMMPPMGDRPAGPPPSGASGATSGQAAVYIPGKDA